VDAERAEQIGLANRVVDDEELPRQTNLLAARLAEGPGMANAATKLALSRELDMDLAGAIEFEAMTQALLMTTADHAEFYAAFQEGRKPRWTGR
jgi:enoyl-CoA hydratase/carnithine racemase